MKQVWCIRERRFKKGCKTRMMMYGAEKQSNLEQIQLKYLKWVPGIDKNTPYSIVL